jgi:hypothetical protein
LGFGCSNFCLCDYKRPACRLYAYEIYGNNFFRLRDLAYALNGTEKQFDVGFDAATGAVVITSGQPYTVIGGEMAIGNSTGAITPTPSNGRFVLDGEEVAFMAYLINGNNFVRLRDVGWSLDFWVGFDGSVLIDTAYGYGPRFIPGDGDLGVIMEVYGDPCRAGIEDQVRFWEVHGSGVVPQIYRDMLRDIPEPCVHCIRMGRIGG